MELYTIPVISGNPDQASTVTLDGRAYRLRLRWIQRIQRWTFDLSTSAEVPILACKGLATRADLLRQVRFSVDCPAGELFLWDFQGDSEATLTSLGGRHRLLYLSP